MNEHIDELEASEDAVLRQAVNDMDAWIRWLPADSGWRFAFEQGRRAIEEALEWTEA